LIDLEDKKALEGFFTIFSSKTFYMNVIPSIFSLVIIFLFVACLICLIFFLPKKLREITKMTHAHAEREREREQ
jgi:Ca2+/Na+ antiporter